MPKPTQQLPTPPDPTNPHHHQVPPQQAQPTISAPPQNPHEAPNQPQNLPGYTHYQQPQPTLNHNTYAPYLEQPTYTGYTGTQQNRKTEDLLLNILLYLGSLLLIGSAALFITSVGSAPVRVGALALGSIIFYTAGLITHYTVQRIRIASYSFTATGLALLPLTGIAALQIWDDGRMLWLITSLIGTLAIVIACFTMRNRIIAYLLVSFFISDTLAATRVAELPFVWYFLCLTILATILSLLVHLNAKLVPAGLREGLVESSRIFVPVTAAVVFFFVSNMPLVQTGMVFTIMSVHAGVFFALEKKLDYYVQLRIYPLLATAYFCAHLHNLPLATSLFFTTVIITNVLAVLICYPVIARYTRSSVQPLIDTIISLSVAGCAHICATLVLAAYSPSFGRHDTVQRLLPYFTGRNDTGTLPDAWVLGVLFLVALLAYWRQLTPPMLLPTLYSSAAIIAILLMALSHGAFYVCFAVIPLALLLKTKQQVPPFYIALGVKLSLFIGIMNLSYTVLPDFGGRAIIMLTAAIAVAFGLLNAALLTVGSMTKTHHRVIETSVYTLVATALMLLRSFMSFSYSTEAETIINTSLYGAAIIGLLMLCVWMMRLAGSTGHIAISSRWAVGIGLFTAGVGTLNIADYYLVATAILVLAAATLAALAFTMFPAHSGARTFLVAVARAPIFWVVVVLAASETITTEGSLLLLSGVSLLLGALSALLYRAGGNPAELITLQAFFYVCCVPALVATFWAGHNHPFAAILCPLAVALLWVAGEWAHALHLRISAAIALIATFVNTASELVHPVHIFTRSHYLEQAGNNWFVPDAPTVFGISTALAVVVLYLGKIFLPIEIPGSSSARPNVQVAVTNNPPQYLTLPMHGPLPNPAPHRAPQRGTLLERTYAAANRPIIIPGIVILTLCSVASMASHNTVVSALLLALTVLSLATIVTQRGLHMVLVLSIVMFVGRFLLTFDSDLLINALEFSALITLALTLATVLQNIMAKLPARSGVLPVGLFISFGIQCLVTLLIWSWHISVVQGTVVLFLSLLVTVLAAVLVDKVWAIIGAALVTIDLAIMLGGLNPLVLMIIAVLLIAGVVWRLLTRDKNNPDAPNGAPVPPTGTAPYAGYNPPLPAQGAGEAYYQQQVPPQQYDPAQAYPIPQDQYMQPQAQNYPQQQFLAPEQPYDPGQPNSGQGTYPDTLTGQHQNPWGPQSA